MFLLLQGIALFILLCYFGVWLFSVKATGIVVPPYYSNNINISYKAGTQQFTNSYSRYDIPYAKRTVTIRYLLFYPSSSRVNSFMGFFAEPLAWWLVFLLASAMLLLTHNTVFSRGTVFELHRKFPWISMEEYFPDAGGWYYERRQKNSPKSPEPKRLE